MFGDNTDGVQDASPFAGGWGSDATDPFTDPAVSNLFSAEIEDIDSSAWDAGASHIWDDGVDDAATGDVGAAGIPGFDFPL